MTETTSDQERDADRDGGAVALNGSAAEAVFQRLVDGSPDAIVVHQHGRYVYVNATFVRWVGAQYADQVRGQTITRFMHPDTVEPALVRMASLRNEGDATSPAEAVLARMDGTTLDVELVSMLTTWKGAPAYHVTFRDLTYIRTAHKSLRYQAAMVDAVGEVIIATTGTGLVTKWNRAAENIYRRPAAHALALPISAAVGASLDPAAIITGGGVVHTTHFTADGAPLVVRVSAAAMDTGYVLMCTDQTKAYAAQLFLQDIVNSLDLGILVIDGTGSVVSANPASEKILGMSSDELTGGDGHGIHRLPAYDADRNPISPDRHPVVQTMLTGKECSGVVIGVDRADGQRIWLRTNCRRLDGGERYDKTTLVSFADITSDHMAHEHLTHSATHDALTGLPNRLAVLNHINDAVRADDDRRLGAVLFIDLDNLKAINDSLGHDSGDELLQSVARCLLTTKGPLDVVGRLGGDEFVVLITGDVPSSELATRASGLERSLSEPVMLGGATVRCQASIGAAVVDRHDRRSATEILRDADAAMYERKLVRRRGIDGQAGPETTDPVTAETE